MNCPKCGSDNVKWIDLVVVRTGEKYKKGYCKCCGRWLWVTLAQRIAGVWDEEDIN